MYLIVVFVYGYFDNSEVWYEMVLLFVWDYYVIVYDVCGVGKLSLFKGMCNYIFV